MHKPMSSPVRPGGPLPNIDAAASERLYIQGRATPNDPMPMDAIAKMIPDMPCRLRLHSSWGHKVVDGHVAMLLGRNGSQKLFWLVVRCGEELYHIDNRHIRRLYIRGDDPFMDMDVGTGPDLTL